MELKLSAVTTLQRSSMLLIVPYGIETVINCIPKESVYLLIVPYGIETIHSMISFTVRYTFNCTLWN